jgi:hypothetical protein
VVFKLPADERIQISAFDDDVAPRKPRSFFRKPKLAAHRGENFPRKKCHLPLVVFLEAKKTVVPDAASGHAMNFRDLNRRMFAGRLAVAPEEIMAGRNVKVADFHGGNMTIYLGGENLLLTPP